MRIIGVLFYLSVLSMASCKSTHSALASLLNDGRYAEARSLLEENQVGAHLSQTADPEALALRTQFTEEIELNSKRTVDDMLDRGKVHQAHRLASLRREICPWSKTLEELVATCDVLLQRIRDTEQRWVAVFEKGEPSVSESRAFLSDFSGKQPWITDSQVLQSLESAAISRLLTHWEEEIANRKGKLEPPDRSLMRSDAASCRIDDGESKQLEALLDITTALPWEIELWHSSEQWILHVARARSLAGVRSARTPDQALSGCIDAAWRAFNEWYADRFASMIASDEITYALLAEAEEWQESLPKEYPIASSLGRAHLTLASRHAARGMLAPLSLLHLRRAQVLGLPPADPGVEAVLHKTLAARSASPKIKYRLMVDVGAAVNPEIQSVVQYALLTELANASSEIAELDYRCSDPIAPAMVLAITDAVRIAGAFEEKTVASSYYSHQQTVANPRKKALETQMASTEASIASRERNYNSAVRLHNIYRSVVSLANANSAYSSYVQAVDQYNALVSIYNVTPETISQAVYLPYEFEEATVRFGWQLTVSAAIAGNEPISLRAESVAEDFVRMGTRAADREVRFRRDDEIDIDISGESSIHHLKLAVAKIKSELNGPLGVLGRSLPMGLSEKEQSLLGWLCHPWGMQAHLAVEYNIPKWAADVGLGIDLRSEPVAPLPVTTGVARPLAKEPLSPEEGARVLKKFICMVESGTRERTLAQGTGTLIGDGGLILTCAHVLVGPQCKVVFGEGDWAGSYSAEVVFINTVRDVALVRASSLSNEDWAPIRLQGSVANGEAILAIGNSAMDIGGVNRGGLSQGIVSNEALERGGTTYLAVDVAIAQGSSGGPIFSLRDGALIGVVQLVATAPGFPKRSDQVAASGFLCLGAPSTFLGAWLGLR